ncbi:MAG: hypothetical protein MHPSP_000334 [Paramarteilia canceri]
MTSSDFIGEFKDCINSQTPFTTFSMAVVAVSSILMSSSDDKVDFYLEPFRGAPKFFGDVGTLCYASNKFYKNLSNGMLKNVEINRNILYVKPIFFSSIFISIISYIMISKIFQCKKLAPVIKILCHAQMFSILLDLYSGLSMEMWSYTMTQKICLMDKPVSTDVKVITNQSTVYYSIIRNILPDNKIFYGFNCQFDLILENGETTTVFANGIKKDWVLQLYSIHLFFAALIISSAHNIKLICD